ncbi:hypothetical protein ACFQZ2_05455 [Streptomonospora algeriensis]|uniref:Tail assembly chaperone n=1 Tax=Streptomonospora algeriensis TaxID=995084 RepID=A0ABW3BA53_9ACTN
MRESLKATILGAKDIDHEDIEIPEWGGVTVRVKGLPDEDIEGYQNSTTNMKTKAKKNADVEMSLQSRRAHLVVKALYDPETDERIFDDSDAPELAKKNAGVINGLYVLIEKLSGMDRTFDEQVADAEKNSASDQS